MGAPRPPFFFEVQLLILLLLLLPSLHAGAFHVKSSGTSRVTVLPQHTLHNPLEITECPVGAAPTAFLHAHLTGQVTLSRISSRSSSSSSGSKSALWGARSNRINGKRPSVLPSPSPFPGALLHLLPGSSVLPNEAYVGQHVRLPVSPSSDLSLMGGSRGPPRLFAPGPLCLHARDALQRQGLPLTRLRWPEDQAREQQKQQQQQQQQPQQQQGDGLKTLEGQPLTFKSVADSGDRHPGKKAFGEDAPLFKHHLYYGTPPWPNAVTEISKEYNEQVQEAGKEREKVPEQWLCDTIFCDDRGTVLRYKENAPPYGGEDEPESGPTTWELLKLRKERQKTRKPHRFIVTAPAGYVAKAGITVGMQLSILNDEQLASVYDNHFAQPKKFREPLLLPDGTCIP
ncbi:hypothetical protein Emag_002107 [Eimeria magna]